MNVVAGAGCGWWATSNASWITVSAGASGSGNGAVTLGATANTLTTARAGTVTVAGITFTLNQAASVVTTPSRLHPKRSLRLERTRPSRSRLQPAAAGGNEQFGVDHDNCWRQRIG